MKNAMGGGETLTDEQYNKLGVPKEYRTPAGYKAWTANRSRGDVNIGRLTQAAQAVEGCLRGVVNPGASGAR